MSYKPGQFEFVLPTVTVEKSADGAMRFAGVASTPALDDQFERVSPECIAKMQQAVSVDRPLDLVTSHAPKAGEEIGVCTECQIGPNMELVVKGEFFDPEGASIYNRLVDGHPYQLSIGGKCRSARTMVEKGQRVRVLEDIALDHICVTRANRARNPETWIRAVAKSMDAEVTKEDQPAVAVEETPPPVVFNENLTETTAEERYEHVSEALWPLLDALRATLRGICARPTEERLPLLTQALADFSDAGAAALGEEIAKAGRRNSGADMDRLHQIVSIAREACGCDDCAGTVSKAGAQESEDEAMSEDAKTEAVAEAEPAPADAEVPEVAKSDEAGTKPEAEVEDAVEPVTEPESGSAPPVEEEPVAKADTELAGDDVMKAIEDRFAALEAKLAEKDAEIAKAREELETLKSSPADGGPEMKPSGEVEKAMPASALVDLVKEAAATGDRRAYFTAVGAKMTGLLPE